VGYHGTTMNQAIELPVCSIRKSLFPASNTCHGEVDPKPEGISRKRGGSVPPWIGVGRDGSWRRPQKRVRGEKHDKGRITYPFAVGRESEPTKG